MKKKFLVPVKIILLLILHNTFVNSSEIDKFPSTKITGYAKINFIYDNNPNINNSFTISSARLSFKSNITNSINYTLALEPTNSSNSNIEMLYDAYIDISLIKLFNLRVGQFKYRFGLEQTIPDQDFELINKSEIVNNLIKPNRDIGLEISKKFEINNLLPSIYLGIYNGSGPNKQDENKHKTFTGKINLNPIKNFTFGFSTYLGSVSTDTTKNRTGVDISYKIKKFLFKTEYILAKDASTEKDGYYFTILYSPLSNLDLISRYDTYNISNINQTNRITLGTNYFLDSNVVIRTNYEFILETPSVDNDLLSFQFQIKF